MLRFVEEILLLLLRDDDGKFYHVSRFAMDRAVAGAVLMDLAMEDRIDTDLEDLTLLSAEPTGDPLLDPTLAMIAAGERRNALYWVEQSARTAEDIRAQALERLVDRGILEQREDAFLWVFRTRRYPSVDGEAEREVKLRIMGVLFGDEIPDPRDVVLICLADVCGIFRLLLSRQELEQATPRIKQVRQMDLIGQAVSQAIREIEISIASAVMF